MNISLHGKAWPGPALWFVLVLPPARHLLESTMILQMMVQIPLLALAGWWLRPLLSRRITDPLLAWNRSGISGFVLASLTAMIWMLPRTMDAALEMPWVEMAKFTGVPLLIGVPLGISWPYAGFVARGVLLVETTATAFRLGWLYLTSPQRLCSNYLLSDQQWLGKIMIVTGAAMSAILAWKLIWGRIDIAALHRRQAYHSPYSSGKITPRGDPETDDHRA